MDVVDDLREDARPVDAVDRGEAVLGAEGRVVEERLDVRLPKGRGEGQDEAEGEGESKAGLAGGSVGGSEGWR